MLNLLFRRGSTINLLILGLQVLSGHLAFALSSFALSSSSSPLTAQSQTTFCPTDLEAAIAAVIDRPQFKRSRWGILVQPLTSQRPLYALNSQRYFIPASSVKLLTTAAALLEFGPQFRIRTSIYGIEPPSTVTSLRVVGRGDPTLTEAELEDLAQQLKRRGIKRVPQLVIEDNYLPGPHLNSTWEWEDTYADYGVAVNSAILNQNSFTLTVLPQQLGQPVQLRWTDSVAARQWRIENQAITAPAGTPYGVEIIGSLAEPVLNIAGELAIDSEPDIWDLAVADPGSYFLESFRRTLLREGIRVDRGLVDTSISNITATNQSPRPLVSSPMQSDVGNRNPDYALAPRQSSVDLELAAIQSPPLYILLQETNQESNNLFAEVLLQLLGTLSTAGDGLDSLQQSLSDLGIDSGSYVLVDGSGLSRHNLLTPEAIVQTLQLMAQSPYAETYQHSLPLAGISGTLENRFRDTPVQGNLLAKTGTLKGISALSGYLKISDYQPLVFSIMLNQSDQPVVAQRAAIDEIVLILSQLRFC